MTFIGQTCFHYFADNSYHQNNDLEEDNAWVDDAPVFDHSIDLTPPESPVSSCATSTHSLSVEDTRGVPEPQPRVFPDYFQFPHSLLAKMGPTLLQPATPPPRIRTYSALSHLSTPGSSRPHTPRRDSILRHSSFASASASPVIRLKSLNRRPSFLTSFPLSSPRLATLDSPPPPPPVPPAPPSQLLPSSPQSSRPTPAALPAPVPSIRGRSHRQPWLTASPLVISLIHECSANSLSGGGIFANGVRVLKPDSQVSQKRRSPLETVRQRRISNALSFKLLARSALKSLIGFST